MANQSEILCTSFLCVRTVELPFIVASSVNLCNSTDLIQHDSPAEVGLVVRERELIGELAGDRLLATHYARFVLKRVKNRASHST